MPRQTLRIQLDLQEAEGQEVAPDRGATSVVSRLRKHPTIKKDVSTMGSIQCLIIPADLDVLVQTMELERGDIRTMQGIVDGHFQVLELEAQKASMFVNEEGKNIGLKMNQRATMLLWLSDSVWRFQDVVAGNVFIIGPPDDEGASTSVPQELVDLLFSTEKYKGEVTTLNDEDSWSSNNLEFPDYWEAAHSVLELASRWRMVSNCRVIAA